MKLLEMVVQGIWANESNSSVLRPRSALPGEGRNRRRPPWEALALTAAHGARPKLDQLLGRADLEVLQLAAVTHLPVTHHGGMRLWFGNFAKGCTGKKKIIQDRMVELHLPFLFTGLHLEPTRYFTCVTLLRGAAACPLSGTLAFEALVFPFLHWLTLFLEVCEGLTFTKCKVSWRYRR